MTGASDMAAFPGAAAVSAAGEEKAAWYREVLDLEPGSKVFLPFARLLMELGRPDEAVSVLRDGLDRHPEFMEARLFLIDVLHRRGDAALCGAEVARLAGLFRQHPDFWEAWGDVSASAGGQADLAVSLGFLGALFRHEGLTLADVLAAGLRALRESPAGRGAETDPAASPTVSEADGAAVPEPIAVPRFDDLPLISAADAIGSDVGPDAMPDAALFEPPAPIAPPLVCDAFPPRDEARERAAPDEKVFSGEGPKGAGSFVSPFIPGDGQEKCSLRTRSMAEVLAEQGDVRGAVDIYEELLAACRPEDRAALLSRLEDLRARLNTEGGAAPVARASASAPVRNAAPARNGMLDLLEKLAVRLETKARQ